MVAEKRLHTYIIDFEPVGRRVKAEAGSTLLKSAIKGGINLLAICGGNGTCNTCKVRLEKGILNQLTSVEKERLTAKEKKEGYRLACQAIPTSDVVIDIPPQSLSTLQRTQLEGEEKEFQIQPPVIAIEVSLEQPKLDDLIADDERIIRSVSKAGFTALHIPTRCSRTLGTTLRENHWHGKVVLEQRNKDSEFITFLPVKQRLIGFAADIGTTKLATYLVDLETGKTLTKCGAMNPQIAYGEDVISRIAFCNREKDGRKILQQKLVQCLNQNIRKMCKEHEIKHDAIVSAVLVGNTVMHHLVCGLPVRSLGEAPYVPAVVQAQVFPAEEINLGISPHAPVYLPPNVAGYVGADHIAMLIASKAWNSKRNIIAMDIGTNTEISLISKGRIFSCSCASGPAFEGAHIQFGMRATAGAIERVKLENGILLKTIDNAAPVGLCGSGIIDIIAELKKSAVIDKRGVFKQGAQYVRKAEKGWEYVLVPANESGTGIEIVISRNDIHEVQLAKAAIQTGWEVLLEVANLKIDELDEFVVAGAFGTYIDIESAMEIGMVPQIPITKFKQIGNAAGMGAKQLLVSKDKRLEAERIKDLIEYVELTTYPNFMDHYLQAMYL
jgi:uncharacterized 2Fe-2S/4Fe-4S cluster protein (DUF4445 family)